MDHGSGNTLIQQQLRPSTSTWTRIDCRLLSTSFLYIINFSFKLLLQKGSQKHSVHYRLRFTLEQLTNQVGYIIVIARVARDLWQRKQTLSSGFALGLGWFTAINPWPRAITITYSLPEGIQCTWFIYSSFRIFSTRLLYKQIMHHSQQYAKYTHIYMASLYLHNAKCSFFV